MHTEIDKQVISRFFTAIDALIEQKKIDSLQSYCTAHGFDAGAITALKDQTKPSSFHFDWLQPLIMDYGISSLWLLTSFGDMFMPMYNPSEK